MIGMIVAFVNGVILPVLHVDTPDTAHQQLQLALVKDLDQVERDKLVESRQELIHLFSHSVDEPPLDHQLEKGSKDSSNISKS